MSIAGSLSRFRILHLRRLRAQWPRTLLSTVGIATAVALVIAVVATWASIDATAERSADVGGGATYRVSRGVGFSSADANKLDAVAGVEAAVLAVDTPVMIGDVGGYVIGIEPNSEMSGLGAAITNVDTVVGGDNVPTGTTIEVTGIFGTSSTIEVNHTIGGSAADRYGGSFIAAPLDEAVKVGGLPAPNTVFVFGNADRDEVLAAAGPSATIETPAEQIKAVKKTFEALLSSLSLVSVLGLVVGGVFVFNNVTTDAREQRQNSALLRALGSNRDSLVWGAIGDGIVVGALGSIVGVVLGVLTGGFIVERIPPAFVAVTGAPLGLSTPLWLLPAGLVVGVGLSVLASVLPARAVGRTQPVDGMRPTSSVDDAADLSAPRSGAIGVVSIAAAFVAPGVLPLFLLVIGSVALVRAAAVPLSHIAAGLARRFKSPGRLSALSLVAQPARVASAMVVLVLGTAIYVAVVGGMGDAIDTLADDLASVGDSDYWVSTTAGDGIASIGLPPVLVEEISAIHGVATATSAFIPIDYEGTEIGVVPITGESRLPTLATAPTSAQQGVRAGDGVVVTRTFINTFDIGVGDMVALPGVVPPVELPILGVSEALLPTSGGALAVSADTFPPGSVAEVVTSVEVDVGDADPAVVRAEIEAIAERSGLPLIISTGEEYRSASFEFLRQMRSIVVLVVLVVALSSGVAIANTFAAAVLARNRELAVVRAVGSTRTLVVRSIVLEAVALSVIGALLGGLVGTYLHRVVSAVQAQSLHVVYHFTPTSTATAIVMTVVVATLASWIAVRRNLSDSLIEALHEQ